MPRKPSGNRNYLLTSHREAFYISYFFHFNQLLIFIWSHEIRNPISSVMQISPFLPSFACDWHVALLHCSSLVKTNLLSLQEQLHIAMAHHLPFTPTRQLMNNIEEDLEALESIYQCGLTQERISNDVLSLGRIQLGKSWKPYFSPVSLIRWGQICFRCLTSNSTSQKRLKTSYRFSRMKREWREYRFLSRLEIILRSWGFAVLRPIW